MSEIKLRKVTKTFGDEIIATENIDLTVEDGEFVVLVGPSGSGKSTILRLIAGLESTTEGEIWLGDRDITNLDPRKRDIAMVFQNYALYPHLTARENIGFGLKMRGQHSTDEIDASVEEVAQMMDITDLLDNYPDELSGGQQQRVALGRAIVRESEAFLMDEPLSNLDAKLRTQMRTEINRLQNRLEMTTIYVTHDQTEAMTMGDKIAILKDGEIQQFTTPINAYYEPANEFVAGFIGSPSMNFFEAEVEHNGKNLRVKNDAFDLQIPLEHENDISTNEMVTLGIRPEDIQVNSSGSGKSNLITTDVVEMLGKEQIIYFEMGSSNCTAITTQEKIIEENQELSVRLPSSRVYLFDNDTGETIKQRSGQRDKEKIQDAHQ